MGIDQKARLSELFDAALALPPADRDRFLSEACASDQTLRHEVETLLRHHDEAPEFLETPAPFNHLLTSLDDHTMVGCDFGPYRVVARLGGGGMGDVYRAHDPKLQRDVALKLLPRQFTADPERRARFAREARVLATLNHPNIGAIYGLEEAGGQSALVLELVEGPTLADRLLQAPMKIAEALAVARQMAQAIEAAHEKGIVHRDLKPANVVLQSSADAEASGSGLRVRVLDFGLAKPMVLLDPEKATVPAGHSLDRTAEGRIVGTPAYMSPEQARGRAVDKRTDIWAFGCVLFEMLSGCRPFEASSATDTFARILEHEPDWSALPAATPEVARRLLTRCLTKDSSRRLRDIGDARLELEDAQNLPAPTGTSGASSGRLLRSRWPASAAVAAAFVCGLAVSGVWLLQAGRPALPNPLEGARFSRVTNFDGTERSAAISRDGRFVAFRSDREGPLDVWLTQIGSGQFRNLTNGSDDEFATEHPSCGFSGDGSKIWLGGGVGRRLRLLPLMGGSPHPFLADNAVTVAWSPDGNRVVYHLQDPGDPLFVADRLGMNARLIFQRRENEHNHFPIWSVDGRWIYFTSGTPESKEMDIWRVAADGGPAQRLTTHNSDVAYPTPIDADTVLYVAHDADGSGPWLWALSVGRRLTRRVSLGVENYLSVAATPDGTRLVATVANPTAGLWSAPLGDRVAGEPDVKPFPVLTANASAPRFGAASLFYLSSLGAGDGVWRFESDQSTEIWGGSDGPVLAPPDVSRDGRRVAIVLRREGKQRLQVLSSDGGELRALADSIDVRGSTSWAPDGKWIVARGNQDGKPGLFKIPVDDGPGVRLTTGAALNPVWSPDGSLIAYAGPNVSAFAPLLAIRPDGAPVRLPAIQLRRDGERVRFTPDGKALIYMQGELRAQNFWRLDLATMSTRQLTDFRQRDTMRTFDITPDGTRIVFDRLRDNADILVIDRKKP